MTLILDREKLELLRFVTDLAEKECDRVWHRQSALMYASMGLFGVFTLLFQSRLFLASTVPAAMGVALAIAWLIVLKLSRYYEARWLADMEELIKSDPTFSKWIRGRNDPRVRRPYRFPTTSVMKVIAILFLVLWSLILVLVIVAAVWQPLATDLMRAGASSLGA